MFPCQVVVPVVVVIDDNDGNDEAMAGVDVCVYSVWWGALDDPHICFVVVVFLPFFLLFFFLTFSFSSSPKQYK